jgi:hypothetical protein
MTLNLDAILVSCQYNLPKPLKLGIELMLHHLHSYEDLPLRIQLLPKRAADEPQAGRPASLLRKGAVSAILLV